MDKASETLFSLKPVTFRARKNMEPARVRYYGLIAEDVAAVDPDLVVYNPEGKPETLRLDSINAMLLNEFLKEHRKDEEQQASVAGLKSAAAKQEAINAELKSTIVQQQKSFAEQEKQIEALASGLQKVSALVENSKPAPQVVLNNR